MEVLLTADHAEAVGALRARRAELADTPHPEDEVGDVPAEIADAGARLAQVRRARPNTISLSAAGDVEEVLGRLTELLGGPHQS